MEEGVVTQFFPKHLQHKSGFSIDISGVLHRVAKLVSNDRYFKEPPLPEPCRLGAPARIRRVIGAVLMLLPKRSHKRGETFVEPQIRPVLGGYQIAEPLMTHLMRDQTISAFQAFVCQHGV